MEIEHVFVVFSSRDGKRWDPVERNNIPDWLRDESVIDRMLAGEYACRPTDTGRIDAWYRLLQLDRPRPAGQLAARKAAIAAAHGLSPGGIALPN